MYLFDSLRILFSYNLSAIKCGFFFFHFKHISCLFLLRVKASYMFNKANYLINFIHKGILPASIAVQVYSATLVTHPRKDLDSQVSILSLRKSNVC